MYNVAVIGSGVIGLSTALFIQKELATKGKVIIFTDGLSPETTGDIAAGLWMPYLLQNTSQEKIIKWSKTTLDFIINLWKNGRAEEAGISLQLMINLTNDKNFQIPEWANIALGFNVMSQQEVKKYGEEFHAGFTFVTFTFEASKFLPFLLNQFKDNGGQIVLKKIQKFEELSQYDVIVNCTGLKSRFLVPDPLVKPVRGQIVRVKAPWQFHTFIAQIDGEDNYVIPNQEVVILGGTHQEDNFSTDIDNNDEKFILNGCYKYIKSLENAEIVKHQVGLRPGRSEVRLELEVRKWNNKDVKIVHNYGHGGSGITLSIGCAIEAAKIVNETLNYKGKSKL